MVGTITSALRKSPLARRAYARVRSLHGRRQGAKLFENVDDYARALYQKADDGVVLRAHDGLHIAIRRNLWDAEIVREVFFERPYTRYVRLAPNPVIVDVGGYIGDFALYAVKYLDAERVIVYEPTPENFTVLTRNIELNGYDDRITAVPKAVGPSGEIVLNVQKLDGDEVHVSSHWYPDGEQRRIPSVSLVELLEAHSLDSVDLLKVDCEGGEYSILLEAPAAVFDRIANIVFEYHEVDGYESKLDHVTSRLRAAGYGLRADGKIVSAARE